MASSGFASRRHAGRPDKALQAWRARQPRNLTAAVERAKRQKVVLCASFVGDTPWPEVPTVYCDSGVQYDWEFVTALPLHVIVAVRQGVDANHAIRAIFDRSNIRRGYPVLVDVDRQEVACIVDGDPYGLWQMKNGTDLWRLYFDTP